MIQLSLDPGSPPATLVTSVDTAVTTVESYGWFVLLAAIVVYAIHSWYSKKVYKEQVYGAARVEKLEEQRRLARLAQQEKLLNDSRKIIEEEKKNPTQRRKTDEERRLERLYAPQQNGIQDDKDDILEGFHNRGGAKGGFNPIHRGRDTSSSSSRGGGWGGRSLGGSCGPRGG